MDSCPVSVVVLGTHFGGVIRFQSARLGPRLTPRVPPMARSASRRVTGLRRRSIPAARRPARGLGPQPHAFVRLQTTPPGRDCAPVTLSDSRNSRPAASRWTRSPWSSRRVPARAGESAAFVALVLPRDQLQPVIDRLASIPSPVPLPFGNRRSLAEAFSDTRHDDSSSANTSRSGGLCGHGRGRAEEHVAAAPPTVMSLFARIRSRPASDRQELEDYQE